MGGLADLSGWRWIFIMEGVLTCVVAFLGYWFLVDFPDGKRPSWRFLGPEQLAWVVARVNQDRRDSVTTPFGLAKFLRAGLDWKTWAYALVFFNTTTTTYAIALFMPIILQKNMGFSTAKAQCLIVPPFVFAGLFTFGTGYLGDRYRLRGHVIVANMILVVIGLPILGFHPSAAVRYFGIFLITAGANSNVPATMSYQANNIRGQWKRAFCSATLVGAGGIGGIAGSLVFRQVAWPVREIFPARELRAR